MPLYEYRCSKCEHLFEKIQKFSAKSARCPKCGAAGKRLISAPAIQFKGSGWYVTDYAGKGRPPKSEASEKSGTKADGDSKTEPKASDGKKKAKKG